MSVGLCLLCKYAHWCHSLDSTHKWHHMILAFDLLRLGWLSPGPFMSLQMALVHPFLWLSSIPLCVHLVFLVHSPVDGPFCKQCALQHSNRRSGNSIGIQPQEDRAISIQLHTRGSGKERTGVARINTGDCHQHKQKLRKHDSESTWGPRGYPGAEGH